MFSRRGPRAERRITLLATVLLVMMACTPRGQMAIAPVSAALGPIQTVFVGSTRKVDVETGRFGAGRSETTQYASFGIAIPPEHTPGEIGWAGRNGIPDPRKDFLTVSQQIYPDSRAFREDLKKEIRAEAQGVREVTLFVHGYNTTFDEGLYRFAQLSHDLELPGAAVHYAWPSAGTAMGYLQDRDSVLFARRGLEALIREIEAAGADRIYLVAHSVGAGLAMEALRSLALEDDRSTLNHIAGVVLISPDIDVDVFRSQAQEIGTLPQPFVIFGSARDKALALSARLTGQRARLGSLADPAKVADLKVTIVDVGAFNTGTGHFNVANSPALIRILDRLDQLNDTLDTDRRLRVGFVPGIVMTIQNATVVVLSPIVAFGEQIEG
jgi:esterase/lipase superfamily enzyme